jgi:hypothetical protein
MSTVFYPDCAVPGAASGTLLFTVPVVYALWPLARGAEGKQVIGDSTQVSRTHPVLFSSLLRPAGGQARKTGRRKGIA